MEEFDSFFKEYHKQQLAERRKNAAPLVDQLQLEFDDFVFESKPVLRRINLSYGLEDLEPAIDQDTMDLHFNILYKNYVTKFNDTGDDFQKAGAFLHQKFFENLTKANDFGCRNMQVLAFLKEHFGSFAKFKTEFAKKAMSIKGNGWVALTSSGGIVQISNHKIISNIVLILDMWEHAYYRQYGTDKDQYIRNFWQVVDWDIVGARI